MRVGGRVRVRGSGSGLGSGARAHAAGELAQLRDHVEGLGQLAERRDAEALGEAVELAEQRDRERRARLERLVRDRRGDDAVEAVGVRLDQRGHRLVGGGLREEALLHAEVAAEERAHGGHRVVAQAVGVRVEDRGDRRERRGHPLLLSARLRVRELGVRARVRVAVPPCLGLGIGFGLGVIRCSGRRSAPSWTHTGRQ